MFMNKHIYHDIPDHQGHQGPLPLLEQKYISGQGLEARVCKQIVFLKGKRGMRVEGRRIFLCNTAQLILQNFAGPVMSVARRKNPKHAHKWHYSANKASHRDETFQQDCHLVSTVSII